MTDIPGPPRVGPFPDFGIDCQSYLEPEFLDLAYRAQAAGWSESEIAASMLVIAKNFILKLKTKDDTERLIASAWHMRNRH